MIIAAKIDLNKIDQKRLFQGKNGASYLDVVMCEGKKKSQHGDDFLIKQSVTKEERTSGKDGAIVGNGRFLVRGSYAPTEPAKKPEAQPTNKPDDSDSIPF